MGFARKLQEHFPSIVNTDFIKKCKVIRPGSSRKIFHFISNKDMVRKLEGIGPWNEHPPLTYRFETEVWNHWPMKLQGHSPKAYNKEVMRNVKMWTQEAPRTFSIDFEIWFNTELQRTLPRELQEKAKSQSTDFSKELINKWKGIGTRSSIP